MRPAVADPLVAPSLSSSVEGREYFFNGTGNTYDTEDVVKNIDTNVRGLKKKEARYYTFSISPSAEEITHLRRTIADTKQVLLESGEAIPATLEDDMMRNYLKNYAVQCMDAYARNLGHPEIHGNRDLMWSLPFYLVSYLRGRVATTRVPPV